MKKELDTKNREVQEKIRTITQVKKIGRRYKTQYDELKVEHDKVGTWRICVGTCEKSKHIYSKKTHL